MGLCRQQELLNTAQKELQLHRQTFLYPAHRTCCSSSTPSSLVCAEGGLTVVHLIVKGDGRLSASGVLHRLSGKAREQSTSAAWRQAGWQCRTSEVGTLHNARVLLAHRCAERETNDGLCLLAQCTPSQPLPAGLRCAACTPAHSLFVEHAGWRRLRWPSPWACFCSYW
jgi:hypothetical protein